MKKFLKLAACTLAVGFMFLAGTTVTTSAADFKQVTVPTISKYSQYETIDAIDSRKEIVDKGSPAVSYIKFTLNEDSWVRFSGCYSLYNHDGVGTHVNIYTNSSLSVMKGEYGWGYWEYSREYINFFSKGTYYITVTTKKENYSTPFEGNINVIAAAVPVPKLFAANKTVAANKKTATITLNDVLQEYTGNVQYRSGNVALSNVNSNTYWKSEFLGDWHHGEGATVLTNNGSGYSFKATKNGTYTIMIQDKSGNRYSKTISVSGIDTVKPVIKGVKNKKVYKKTVTIKFSDKLSGIKSAKLNGKKIKNGKKVSKAGKYKLVVTDKAGNKRTITFTIKKKTKK